MDKTVWLSSTFTKYYYYQPPSLPWQPQLGGKATGLSALSDWIARPSGRLPGISEGHRSIMDLPCPMGLDHQVGVREHGRNHHEACHLHRDVVMGIPRSDDSWGVV
ncbi:uncharacterized protein BO96DRAFT_430930 [Aspergillus niger CBS 101883]|uniref:Uncharacterized protein n=2 Tax=Aspergillus niger TaxID=5061 RepID=A5AAG0_ASPNC|nr:uncharacterized protein BO96DRAFT_430930 [Aspergillus niger CBS 101883]XP_059603486.1 hypothetical protein An02g10530 [Aspergillus niger]PYH59826.1 hypothetical protein BO96DRAFT_430930 [Aspergillus niger CBS 101883]CAK44402.1 hypothetical protein An02g10530 [Aspergillus niger]